MRRIIGVAVAVLAVTLSARAAIVAGPEREVAKPSLGLAYGTQTVEAVASDGTNFLVAWSNANGFGSTLYLSVVGPDGTPLTSPNDAVHINAGRTVSMVWIGDAYLVVWADDHGAINVARVTREGQFDGAAVKIADQFSRVDPDALAWDGHRALLTYVSQTQQQKFVLLDDHARVVRDDLPTPVGRPSSVVVSAVPGRFLAVWSTTGLFAGNPNSSAFAISIDDDGNAAPSPAVVAGNVQTYVSGLDVAPAGDRVAVTFTTTKGTAMRAYVTPSTLAVETLPQIAVSTEFHANLVRSGSEVLLYWPLYRDGTLFLEAVDFATGASRESRIGPSIAYDVRIASNGDSLLAVWSDRRVSININDYANLLNAALLDASGATVKASDTKVAVSFVSQGVPSIASAGNVSLVAWIEQKETVRGDLMVRRVDSRGVAIDAAPLLIEKDVPANVVPVAGFTGQVWIVAYAAGDGSHVSYRRIATSGALIDATPNELGIVGPLFATNAKTSVFAGRTADGLAAVRFTPAGEKIDATPLLITARAGYAASIAAAEDEFLVVWSEGSSWWQFPSPNLVDVYGARLDGSGAPIDSTPIAIAATKHNEGAATAASNGREFLVAYIDQGTLSTGSEDLHVVRVLHEGVVSEDKTLGSSIVAATIAASAGRYFLVYANVASGAAEGWAATVDEAGNFVDAAVRVDQVVVGMNLAPIPGGVLLGYVKIVEGGMRDFLRPLTVAASRNRGVRH